MHTSVFLQSSISKTNNCACKDWHKILYNKNTYTSEELHVYLSKRKCPAPQTNVSPLVLLLGIRMMPKRVNLNLTLLQQGGWARWSTEVPSNPYHSVILGTSDFCFCCFSATLSHKNCFDTLVLMLSISSRILFISGLGVFPTYNAKHKYCIFLITFHSIWKKFSTSHLSSSAAVLSACPVQADTKWWVLKEHLE